MVARYRALLDDRRLVRTFALVTVGRFGYALLPLCLLFTVARSTRLFGTAATALASYGISGLVMPVQARLLDRFGQRRVLPAAATGFVVALAVTAVMGSLAVRGAGAWVVASLACGLTAPSLGPSMRAQWRGATGPDTRAAAYSLDAVVEEVAFLVGPVVASVVLALGPAWHGVVAVALLIPVGVVGLVLSPFAPAPRPDGPLRRDVDRRGPLRGGAFRRLLLVMALAGAATGSTLTAVAALADGAGRPSATGLVEAAAGVASVAGGLWWGSRRRPRPWRHDLAALLGARVPLLLGCALLPRLWAVGVFVALAGLTVSPLYVVGFSAGDQVTDPQHHTEASTWITSVNNVGISLGTASIGWVYAGTSAAVAFGAVAAVTAAGALACLPGTWFTGRRRRGDVPLGEVEHPPPVGDVGAGGR